jgi:integrase
MAVKWIKTKFSGVRYYEHLTRKHGTRFDRYYAIRYQIKGKRHEKGLGWASSGWSDTDAAIALAKLKDNVKNGEGPPRFDVKSKQKQFVKKENACEKNTFGELMAEYLEWAQGSKRHWANDEYRYRVHLAELLGTVALKEISPRFLEEIKKKLTDKGLAPATVRHCLAIIRQVFNKAALWGRWEGKNPIQGVALPSQDNRKERTITYEEEQRLMSLLKQKSPRTWAMAMVALYGGLHFEEVAKLRRHNLDLEQGLIHVDGKGGRPRTVPINQTLQGVFKEYCPPTLATSALLFPDRNGHPPNKVSHSFWRALAEAGLNDDAEGRRYRLDFHALRHSWATRLGNQGVSINVLRDLGGWSDFQMVSRYCKSSRDLAQAAVSGLDYAPDESSVLSFIKQGETHHLKGSQHPKKPRSLSRTSNPENKR